MARSGSEAIGNYPGIIPLEKKIPEKVQKLPLRKRTGFKVVTAATGAVVATTSVVVAALGETDNLPDPLQGFYDKIFHPGKVAEEKSNQPVKDNYDVSEASEDLTRLTNEVKAQETIPPTTATKTRAEENINIPKPPPPLIGETALYKKETTENKEVVEEAMVIRSGPNKTEVALTFDDCWSESAVKEILQIAKENEIKVTFFPTGRIIKKYPELWQQVIAEGHEIANHTYSHPDLRKLSEEKIMEEIEKTQEALDEALGYHYEMKYLRPPGGGFNQKVQKATFNCGIKYLAMWAVDDGAITTFKDSPENILPWLENKTDGGEFVLFHVSKPEIKILPDFIKYLKTKDLSMGTLDELLNPPPPPLIPLS